MSSLRPGRHGPAEEGRGGGELGLEGGGGGRRGGGVGGDGGVEVQASRL